MWCLHDEAPIKPWRIDTRAATAMLESQTRCKIKTLKHAMEYDLF